MANFSQIIFLGLIALAYASHGRKSGYYGQSKYYQEQSSCGHGSKCPYPSGLFENPYDCCSFYNCDRCKAYKQDCAPGTHFAPHLKVCAYPKDAKCTAGNKQCHLKAYGW